jgi:hypothetical protein
MIIILTDSGAVREFIQNIDGLILRYGPVKCFTSERSAMIYAKLEGIENYTTVQGSMHWSYGNNSMV